MKRIISGLEVTIDGNKAWAQYEKGYGALSFFTTEAERRLTPEELAVYIGNKVAQGVYRCSSCGFEMQKSEVKGWPLFCGVACGPCAAKHEAHAQEEIKRGHVCRMCRKPYSKCCC